MQLSEDGDKKAWRAKALQFLWGRLKEHPLSRLGPGLITGVADDDPSGIATYSQGGGFAERHLIRDLARASQCELCVFPLAARATRFFYGGVAGVTRGVT